MASPLPAAQWWRKPFGMFQTNLREINADMDVEKALDFIEAHGAQAWLIGTGGILAYYPTDLPFQLRNPLLTKRTSGDLVGDAIIAAHKRGIRLLCRMDFSKVQPSVATEHPDWCFRSPTGELQTHTGDLVSVCPCGPWYQEKVFEILAEVTTRYPVDGVFFNWMSFNETDYNKVYHGVCHCPTCVREFPLKTGIKDLPDGPQSSSYETWLKFSKGVIDDLTGRIRAFISERAANAGLILGTAADIMFHEANNALGRELWHHATSEWVSAFRSYRPDVPVLVNSVTFLDMPYRMAGEEPHQFAQYLVQTISRGGNPSTYIMGAPEQIPYPCYELAGQVTRFHKKWKDEVYTGMDPCAKIGLVRPDRLQQTADQYSQSQKEFRGLYSGLQQRHILFDVIAQEFIPSMAQNGGIGRYEVIILPDLGKLSEDTVTVLDELVDNGHNVILTGASGMAQDGFQLKCSPAVACRRIINKREQIWSSYVCPVQAQGDLQVYPAPVVPLYGAYYFCDWKSNTTSYLKMLEQAPFAPPEKAYGNKQVDEPGYFIGKYGQGQIAYVPWTVGRAYHDLGLTVIRDMFCDIIGDLHATDVISTDLPEQVEITLNRNAKDLIVHINNMSGARKSNFGPPIPIRGSTLTISGAKNSVTARSLIHDAECEVISRQANVVILLPEVGIFDVIVLGGV
ncbi:hypothetical protein DACRYDRAFT_103108 [Dacryopinax primogenitus]|uniref:Beta-galactosidase trimerisation domain-containing protein n=1 Tax=Dacryopinax primogenitus (strain DJM 731) TaxID=1858805 RepID=M5GCD2_DACPD|nr:uncharacterized protein DACRYDRAFT_103108 [Dacryopinax primogenitus]EJU06160.1 hypothetical protein DACRYDRAFT_103108 [Dacryopinax primogenitus]